MYFELKLVESEERPCTTGVLVHQAHVEEPRIQVMGMYQSGRERYWRKTALQNHHPWSSSLVGLFCRVRWWRSRAKIRTGTRSNRRRKWSKDLGWWKHGRYYVTGARRQEFELGCGMVLNSTGHNTFTMAGRLRSDSARLIMNILNRSRDLAWARGGTTDVTNARTCHFFAVCLTAFPFEFRPQTFTIRFYGKKSIKSELKVLECSLTL